MVPLHGFLPLWMHSSCGALWNGHCIPFKRREWAMVLMVVVVACLRSQTRNGTIVHFLSVVCGWLRGIKRNTLNHTEIDTQATVGIYTCLIIVVCMYLCDVYVYVCLCVYMCLYVPVCISMYVCTCLYGCAMCVYVCMSICVSNLYVCVCMCMCCIWNSYRKTSHVFLCHLPPYCLETGSPIELNEVCRFSC